MDGRGWRRIQSREKGVCPREWCRTGKSLHTRGVSQDFRLVFHCNVPFQHSNRGGSVFTLVTFKWIFFHFFKERLEDCDLFMEDINTVMEGTNLSLEICDNVTRDIIRGDNVSIGTGVAKPTGTREIKELARARVSKRAIRDGTLERGAGEGSMDEVAGDTKLAVPSHEEPAWRGWREGGRT